MLVTGVKRAYFFPTMLMLMLGLLIGLIITDVTMKYLLYKAKGNKHPIKVLQSHLRETCNEGQILVFPSFFASFVTHYM